MNKIGDFVGEYTVRWVDGAQPILGKPEGDSYQKFLIGTGTFGADPPWMTSSFDTLVGFSVVQYASGQPPAVVLSSSQAGTHGSQQLALSYVDGVLQGVGIHSSDNTVVMVQLSLYTHTSSGGGVEFKALYGVTAQDDPEDVAVWTADNTPP
jgi:hypothetical protein